MTHTIFIIDYNNPDVRRKILTARRLEEINEFSTVKEISSIIANKMNDELVRQFRAYKPD